jgi:hypothetical protein
MNQAVLLQVSVNLSLFKVRTCPPRRCEQFVIGLCFLKHEKGSPLQMRFFAITRSRNELYSVVALATTLSVFSPQASAEVLPRRLAEAIDILRLLCLAAHTTSVTLTGSPDKDNNSSEIIGTETHTTTAFVITHGVFVDVEAEALLRLETHRKACKSHGEPAFWLAHIASWLRMPTVYPPLP